MYSLAMHYQYMKQANHTVWTVEGLPPFLFHTPVLCWNGRRAAGRTDGRTEFMNVAVVLLPYEYLSLTQKRTRLKRLAGDYVCSRESTWGRFEK